MQPPDPPQGFDESFAGILPRHGSLSLSVIGLSMLQTCARKAPIVQIAYDRGLGNIDRPITLNDNDVRDGLGQFFSKIETNVFLMPRHVVILTFRRF